MTTNSDVIDYCMSGMYFRLVLLVKLSMLLLRFPPL
jgi:hypothetical protein